MEKLVNVPEAKDRILNLNDLKLEHLSGDLKILTEQEVRNTSHVAARFTSNEWKQKNEDFRLGLVARQIFDHSTAKEIVFYALKGIQESVDYAVNKMIEREAGNHSIEEILKKIGGPKSIEDLLRSIEKLN